MVIITKRQKFMKSKKKIFALLLVFLLTITACSASTSTQRKALKRADTYLNYSAFSHDGLIDQLEFDGFDFLLD